MTNKMTSEHYHQLIQEQDDLKQRACDAVGARLKEMRLGAADITAYDGMVRGVCDTLLNRIDVVRYHGFKEEYGACLTPEQAEQLAFDRIRSEG